MGKRARTTKVKPAATVKEDGEISVENLEEWFRGPQRIYDAIRDKRI